MWFLPGQVAWLTDRSGVELGGLGGQPDEGEGGGPEEVVNGAHNAS